MVETHYFEQALNRYQRVATLGSESSPVPSVCQIIMKRHLKNGSSVYEDSLDACARLVLTGEADIMVAPVLHPAFARLVTELPLNPLCSVVVPIPDILLIGKMPIEPKAVLACYSAEVHRPLVSKIACTPHGIMCSTTSSALECFVKYGNKVTDCCITNAEAFETGGMDLHVWRILKRQMCGVFVILGRGEGEWS